MGMDIKTPGVHHMAFKDPDRIAWEFYMAWRLATPVCAKMRSQPTGQVTDRVEKSTDRQYNIGFPRVN